MPINLKSREQIKALILEKMYRHGYIAGRHSERATILRTYKNQSKEANKAMDELIKQGLVIQSTKTNQAHVYLNKYKIAEIKELIGM